MNTKKNYSAGFEYSESRKTMQVAELSEISLQNLTV